MALAGCETRYTVARPPIPEGLLTDCPPPRLIADEATQDDLAIQVERQEVAKWGRCNYLKFDGTRKYIRGLGAPKGGLGILGA